MDKDCCVHYFIWSDDRLTWRENDNTPPSGRYLSSPHDTDARYATKRQIHWIGYKIHRTETDGDEQPNLITSVATVGHQQSTSARTRSSRSSLA
jgi:hypothetical protein